jgi:DNA ligase 1
LHKKLKDVKEAFEMVGLPAAIEYKYDGFRMLIGKQGDKVSIHTRRLENVTAQFPEVAKLVRENISAESCILDSEAVSVMILLLKNMFHFKIFLKELEENTILNRLLKIFL